MTNHPAAEHDQRPPQGGLSVRADLDRELARYKNWGWKSMRIGTSPGLGRWATKEWWFMTPILYGTVGGFDSALSLRIGTSLRHIWLTFDYSGRRKEKDA